MLLEALYGGNVLTIIQTYEGTADYSDLDKQISSPSNKSMESSVPVRGAIQILIVSHVVVFFLLPTRCS